MTKSTTDDILLDVNNIEVVYNDIVQVLRGVSLNVTEGSIVALLGTNGAGKTTTLRAISGLLKPENGFIPSEEHINQFSKIKHMKTCRKYTVACRTPINWLPPILRET